MKKLLIVCTMLTGFTVANAQVTAGISHNKWEENDNSSHKMASVTVNEFAGTEMSLDNGFVKFTELPVVKRAACAIITNAEGEFIKQTKITPEQNTMDIKRLRGGLYFVTIVYRGQSKKAFTLNL